MNRNWIDLGEVLSGRDLAEGERVTLNVFDRRLNTLLEQISFRPSRQQTGQRVWVADFCRHINTHSALVRAGTESDSGEWQVLESSYQNHFWGICSRELRVVAPMPRQINWSSERVALHSEKTLSSANTSIRVNVRSATGERLETITFTPSAKRLTPGLWTKDLAVQINNTSLFVRAGRENGDRIEPYWEGKSNYVWIPKGSGITVTWNFNGPREAGRIPSDRDAVDQERISLLAFDNVADKPLDRITLIARAEKKRLKKDQWPADLATQINASSSHAKAGDSANPLIYERYSELRTFTTALHLDNWVQGDTLLARADLQAAERVVVTVTTAAKGNFCEALTFTPDPARLTAAKWAHDLAVHINQHSNYLKAGVKNTASKHITPQENSTSNLIWIPKDSGLKVSWDLTRLKELGAIYLDRDVKVNEACKAFVLDDTTEDILREITFSAAEGRNGRYLAGKDLATRINSQTQLIVAGQKAADARPEPIASNSANKLWGCAKNVRAFTTLMSLRNWDKGERIGQRDLREDEQVVLIVRGGKTGRIFESLLFTPTPGRFTKTLWPKDFASLINARSRFVRGGEENTTLGLMEPMHKVDVNFFWTPKGSGLEVEYQVISGIPYDVPGMTREARELFDQYAEAKKCISVDAKTGQATLQIPIVELFADDGFSNPLTVSLSCDSMFGVHVRLSGGTQAVARVAKYEREKFILTLRDGRGVKVDRDMAPLNGGDFKIELVKSSIMTGPKEMCVVTGFSVLYKDGVTEVFEFSCAVVESKQVDIVRMIGFTLPSGSGFEFVYGIAGQLKKVLADKNPVLEVEWTAGDKFVSTSDPGVTDFDIAYGNLKFIYSVDLKSILVFPGEQREKRVWNFPRKSVTKLETRFELDGFSVSGKSAYLVKQDESGRLTGVEVEQQHPFTEGKKTETDRLLYRETLLYTVDGKVDRHVISPGGGIDDLVHDYTYDGDLTRLTACYRNAVPRTAFVRTYRLSDGQAYFEEYGSEAVPICKQRSHSLDKNRKWLVSHTTSWEGDVRVDEASLTVDAIGNPVRRAENDKITYWTYYNNYQQFKVTETKVKVEDWSMFGCLFKGFDYINPVGGAFAIGGSGGLTWGTRIDTTVEMLPTSNDYAKKTFNLPVEIKHSGSDRPLSCDVESELVCRLVDGQEQAQRLSFFGYSKVNEQVRVQHKLVILQPDFTRVSVVAEQLAVATAAAQPFINSLKAQIGKSSGDAKKTFEQTLADLTKSLDAQSKVNDEGFKLNAWKAASMVLEAYEYHTDKALPGHGTVKSVEMVLLDGEGKTVEASRRKTDFAYSEDAADASRLTITTTISRSGETDVVSSQTRSRNTGKLYENLDTEGIRAVYTYDPQGNLQSETTSQGGKTLRTTTHTLTRQLVSQYDSEEDGTTTRIERDALGRKQALWLKPSGASSFIETRRWKYDALGRTVSSVETDYGKDNKQVSQRQTTWSYDELNGRITTSHVLKDAAGKDLKKIIQVQVPGVRGERFTQGNFSVDRQFNADKGTLTEHYATSGSGGCKIERSVSRDGLVKAVRYLKIDKSGKESEHDRIDYTYDAFAQLSSARPKLGAASAYTYDPAGRLLGTSRDGAVLSNTYDPASLAAVASESHVSSGKTTSSLGKQTIDMLGRTTGQTVNGSTTGYGYTGASTSGSFKKPGAVPPALGDYVGSVDRKTRTHTQQVGDQHSTLVFSTSGRLLSFTDLTKDTTTYTYDFFDRVTASSNAQCVCTFTYADNGLLTSESIKAVKAGNLTMKVDYTYDELGQEIRRTFTCDGLDTLGVERTLLADGRLGKSTLKLMKTDKELHSDSYEYDSSLRLKKWISSTRSRDAFSAVCWETWSYDGLGNVTRMSDPVHQIERVFEYDAAKAGQANQISQFQGGKPLGIPQVPIHHDSSGNTTGYAGNQLSYHGNGQVKSHSLDKGGTYTFSYDDEGRVRGGSIDSITDTYHYRGDSVYAVVTSDTKKKSGFAKRSLVLRNDSRACLMQDAVSDDKTSRSFELRDANGTVFASVDLGSKVITCFFYTPYGQRIEGVKGENWLGFKGEPLNRRGFYHLGNGYRLYDPTLGRFLSRDSRSPFGVGGAAAYAFCNGDPVNNADPNGHQVIAQYSRWGSAPAIQSTAFRIVVGATGVLLAPFTAGTSMLLAIATTALAAFSFAFDVASIIIAESDPQLSRTLEAWGQVFGIAGAAAGMAMTAHGWKGMPRKWFTPRGGPSVNTPVKWPKTLTEVRLAQQSRANFLTRLTEEMGKARAAGTFDDFKASYLAAETVATGGLSLGASFSQRVGHTVKDLFKGTIRQVDDSLFDYLGNTLDLYTGPAVLVHKFIAAPTSKTEIISIVAGPVPGREKLFP